MLKPGDYLPGEKIRIEAVIGEGAFGVVYRAWDETLSRAVAVKELRRDAPGMGSTTFGKYVDRFRREARVQAQFTHPHIVHVYGLVEQGDALYLVMEFVDGSNLRDELAQRGPLPLEEAVKLTLDLLDALAAVHKHKWDIVHRDIKPSNVLVADGRAKLTDFGLALLGGETSLINGYHPGTPLYMSPEQERPNAFLKPASDLYSVGCVLFELLTGRPYKQVDDDPNALLRLRPDAPPALAQALQRAIAENPTARYRRAADFATELRAWLGALQAAREAEKEQQRREAEATAQRQREAAVEARRQREAEEAARKQREQEELARQQREAAARKAAQERQRQEAAERARRQQVLRQALPWVGLALGGLVLLLAVFIGGKAVVEALQSTPAPTVAVAAATETQTPAIAPTQTPAPPPTWTPTPEPTVTATAPLHALGDTWTRPADGMVMVYVPAGEFQMGSEYGDDDEKPLHMVTLDPFWLDRTEVNVMQFRRFVEATGYETTAEQLGRSYAYTNSGWQEVIGTDWVHPQGPSSQAEDNHPVVHVSGYDAISYCDWIGGRLPTEAEWEYAARGSEGLIYPWGDIFDGTLLNFCDKNCARPWADEAIDDGYEFTAPVGSYPGGVSWVGALDMAGNVWEWIADWYAEYPSGRQINPTGPATGDFHVLRGGSWNNPERVIRSTNRDKSAVLLSNDNLGFRCAMSLSPNE